MNINGSMICQNGISEILRAIESVYPIVDNYYILDGGSTDGTWELLNKYKDVYNLTLFQHKYIDQDIQRNYLLTKTPKDYWYINIDQDEVLSRSMTLQIKEYINFISPAMYTDLKRELPLALQVFCINLVKDTLHYDVNTINTYTSKVFYFDRNLHWDHGYHCNICYRETDRHCNCVETPKTWAIKHYAYLNPDRIKNPTKGRSYKLDEWDIDTKKVQLLPLSWI